MGKENPLDLAVPRSSTHAETLNLFLNSMTRTGANLVIVILD